jgi:hypothetical protein
VSEWIPFLQSLVWPIFLSIFLFFIRAQVSALLTSIKSRIEGGDPFQAGPSGISLGQSDRKFTRLINESESADKLMTDTATRYKDVVYLVHSVTGPRIDSDGVERRGIRVILDADSDEILDKVERVVYHLHPTFPNPDREVIEHKRHFELRARGWGEFNLTADVYFNGYKKPLTLYRYINF